MLQPTIIAVRTVDSGRFGYMLAKAIVFLWGRRRGDAPHRLKFHII
jgi:hypothetical protein